VKIRANILTAKSLTNGLINFTDPDWTNHPTRFYRIRRLHAASETFSRTSPCKLF
jgi:hypothetical protein